MSEILKKENLIKDQVPKPFPSLLVFYKEILPAVIKQATNPDYYYKIKIPSK